MARPQPSAAAGLQRRRPEDHVFESTAPSSVPPVTSEQTTSAANAANRNDAIAARRPVGELDPLVKVSVRIPPAAHRHMKVVCAEQDLTIQGIAVDALIAHLQQLGRPLPEDVIQQMRGQE